MNFKPYNRHLLLQEKEAKEEPEAKPTILVPDDYKSNLALMAFTRC